MCAKWSLQIIRRGEKAIFGGKRDTAQRGHAAPPEPRFTASRIAWKLRFFEEEGRYKNVHVVLFFMLLKYLKCNILKCVFYL